jgi:glycosyltransferase involved in cell wall biosynthesis
MSELPVISVVVPSFNQGRFLEQALASIFDQEYPRAEVIVVDGGSSDDSVAIIRRYEDRLLRWRSGPDGGQAAAIEEGVSHASGDLVAWLNSDDFYCPDALWRVARAYLRHPGFGLYVGNGLRFRDGSSQPFCRRHLALHRRALVEGLDYVLQPATFFSRRAWQEAGGLDPGLRYCLDWDLILRIARSHPAVLINEFLAASREYDETKTAAGGWGRVDEIVRMTARHSGRALTAGALHYAAETAIDLSDGSAPPSVRHHLYAVMRGLQQGFARDYGNSDGFPETGDPQDAVDLPVVDRATDAAIRRRAFAPPSISVVTPSFQQARFLRAALDSVLEQGYPRVESIVRDGGSTDGSVDVLREYGPRLGSWTSAPDRGPASAINAGLEQAGGEIVSWLNSDDVLAEGALWEVGRAFAEDPDLDVVYGNALYIDQAGALATPDHGGFRTGLYYGAFQPVDRIPYYWTYVHSVPQPTVFFRRRLLERCGRLDESYHFIFDFELFFRFAAKGARIRKLEKTLAFYRLHADAKTSDWSRFLVELYRFSRPRWPALGTPEYATVLRGFLNHSLAQRFGSHRGWRFWLSALAEGASAVTRIGNPERLRTKDALGWLGRLFGRAGRQTT